MTEKSKVEGPIGKCFVDGHKMLIDNIERTEYGHLHLECPCCGWAMSVRHSLYPDLDAQLGCTKRFMMQMMTKMFGEI